MQNTFVDVLLPVSVKELSYKVPNYLENDCKIGQLVLVMLRNRFVVALVVNRYKAEEIKGIKYKSVLTPIYRKSFCNNYQLQLWRWIAAYYGCEVGDVFNSAIHNHFKNLEKIKIFYDKENEIIVNKYFKLKNKTPFKKFLDDNTDIDFEQLYKLLDNNTIEFANTKGEYLAKLDLEQTQKNFPLNKFQKIAFDEINNSFEEKSVVLLHGVTSSGKTEIYIHLIKQILEKNAQVLYLLPEIALTTQIISRLKKVFAEQIVVYHSKLTDNERVRIWHKLLDSDKATIVLGVRSAIFLPFSKLELVIIDEEHETSFKQFSPAPRYNARDSAIYLAKLFKAKTLLGTATPSLETYYKAQNKKFGLVKLEKRHKEINLPKIIIADIHEARRKKIIKENFTPTLLKHIEQALSKDEQIILFQNRRGFAPYLQCNDCKEVIICDDCNVSLSYHKKKNKLICHYCGIQKDIPTNCNSCGSHKISSKSFGTEKVEEDLQTMYPQLKIQRLDSDTTSTKKKYEKIISDFEDRKTDVLIGTQMVSKGLDFSNVNLVGILNADNLLNYPDFRAFERSFQMMLQVSGRAGRSQKQGTVIIQTTKAKHKIIKQVVNNDYLSFFSQELKERAAFKYPPFYFLIRITIKHRFIKKIDLFADILSKELRLSFKDRVIGPEYPIIDKIQKYHLKEILLKLESKLSEKKCKKLIINSIKKVRKEKQLSTVITIVDVDPY